MKSCYLTLGVLMTSMHASIDAANLPRSTPEAQGIPSGAILRLIEAAEEDPANALHGLVIVRHGHIVAEGYWAPYAADQPHELHSLSKSFTSTAVGLAQAEGLLSIDDTVLSFFPEEAPEKPSDQLKGLHIRQLLMMSTGHTEEPEIFRTDLGGRTLVQGFFDSPIEFKPGTHFLYNTAATYMQSAIVQTATGERVRDYLVPRLFEPLGIATPRWDQSPEEIDFGGFGLFLRTMDLAKFGQLLLQEGEWNGEPLVSAEWIEQATRKQTANGCYPDSDWDQGYGYQFWMNTVGGYRGDGAFGQFCIVLPEHDLVIAANAACRSMAKQMRWYWNILLPALADEPLPGNPEAARRLDERLASLSMPMPDGQAISPAMAERVSHAMEENALGIRQMEARFTKEVSSLRFTHGGGVETLAWSPGTWTRCTLTRDVVEGPIPCYVSGAWVDDQTLKLHVIYEGRAQNIWITIGFGEDRVTVSSELNVNFGPTRIDPIEGIRVGDN